MNRPTFACALATALLAFAGFTQAAAPLLEKNDLFQATVDGYGLYRIPGIVVTKRGTVLAYCEARRTGKSDWDAIDILMRRSTDGGKTWSPRAKIADVPGPKTKNIVALERKQANPDDVTYNNAVAIPDANGAVHLLYCLEYARCFYIRSDDDGATWSKPVEITATFEQFRSRGGEEANSAKAPLPNSASSPRRLPGDYYNWKVLATGPAHGIQLRTGRLVVPVWLALGTAGNGHSPSVTASIYSDDLGRTWSRGDIVVPNTEETPNPNETVVVQLADGRVMFNVRNHSSTHRRLVTISDDGATRWSKPRYDDALLEPVCMGSIVRLTAKPVADKNRIVFANPHTLDRADGKAKAGSGRDRKNLSLKLSYDEGQTWAVNKSLEPGNSAYSDLAVLPDGTILCFYERGGETDNDPATRSQYAFLTVARFNLEWLTDGKDSFK